MAVKDYTDPRWQRVRLQILSRDKFRCAVCDRDDATLHVHHRVYEKKKKIWDAKPEHLVTLCETCHERCENIVSMARKYADRFITQMAAFRSPGDQIKVSPIEVMMKIESFNYKPLSDQEAMKLYGKLLEYFFDASGCAQQILGQYE